MSEDKKEPLQFPTRPQGSTPAEHIHQGTPPQPVTFPTSLVQRNQLAEKIINTQKEQEYLGYTLRHIFASHFEPDHFTEKTIQELKEEGFLPEETPDQTRTVHVSDAILQRALAIALLSFQKTPSPDVQVAFQTRPYKQTGFVHLQGTQDDTRQIKFSVHTKPDGTVDKVLGFMFLDVVEF